MSLTDGKSARPGSAAQGGARWYVASVKAGQEETVSRHLERQGFEPFTPTLVRTVRHARRIVERRVALFPGYVFVRFDMHQCAWRSVNGTFGVRSLVMAGEYPLPVPHGLVEDFMKMSDQTGVVRAALHAGQRVQVLGGPFANLLGTIERMDDRGRAHVLLRLLNSEVPVEVDSKALWPAA